MNKHLSFTLFIALFAVFFMSCNKDMDGDISQNIVVTFDSNGGSVVAPQTVANGEIITEPSLIPIRDGYNFDGWYAYNQIFVKWDFGAQTVTKDMTLYAKWTSITPEEENSITVSLLESDTSIGFEQTVILFENEDYLIKAPLYSFISGMNNLFGLDYDKFLSILKKIIADGKENNLLYSSTYFDTYRSGYVLANCLENGLCYCYDKKNERIVKQIVFDYTRNTVSLAGERKFYLDNTLFLETVDSFIGYKEKIEEDNRITVSLLERDDYAVFEKSVILFEDESHLITTPLSHFLSGLSNFIYWYDDLTILEKIVTDGQKGIVLDAAPYIIHKDWPDYVNERQKQFVLATFLENGQCYFYDKVNKNTIKQIVVEYWADSPAPLSGGGGRRFYIYNNDLFLETVDWIS